MTEPTTHTLDVPGAILTYDVHEPEKSYRFNLYQDRRYGFTIHAPSFREVQERAVSQVFTSQGGKTSFENLCQACRTCNEFKPHQDRAQSV